LTTSVNLLSSLNLGSNSNAILGFTAGTPGTGLTSTIQSWSVTALNSQSTTTDSSGNYNFTGLMPLANYTITQVVPSNYVQSSPLNTIGIFSESSLPALVNITSSVASGDFNSDGIPDIAYATSLNNNGKAFQITYAYGIGNGKFGTPVVMSIPLTLTAPALATPSFGSAAFDAQIVSGTFGNSSRDQIAYIATMAKGGHVIVIYDIYTNSVLNELEVTKTSVAPISTNNVVAGNTGTFNNIAVGDLNHDGYDDLAVSTFGGVYTIVSLQNIALTASWTVNPSTMATPLLKPSISSSSSAISFNAGVSIADYNQDGNLDLIAMNVEYVPNTTNSDGEDTTSWKNMTVDTSVQLAYGAGNGISFQTQGTLSYQSYSSENIDTYFSANSNSAPLFPIPFGLSSSDTSGDGIPDLQLSGYTSTLQPAVFMLTQSSSGNFTASNTFLIPNGKPFSIQTTPGANNTVVAASTILQSRIVSDDYNSDGYMDLSTVDPNSGQYIILTTSSQPLVAEQTQTILELAGGALPQFAIGDYNLDGYSDIVVPGSNNITSQIAPVMILNGTINAGSIAYTPSNGQVLTGQNFSDIYFGGSAVTTISASFMKPPLSNQAVVKSASVNNNLILTGQIFLDQNQNSRVNAIDSGLTGIQLYLDLNHNGQFDPEFDTTTFTGTNGYYTIYGLQHGQDYSLGFTNLPLDYIGSSLSFTTPVDSQFSVVHRSLSLQQRWSIVQPALRSIDPLIPVTIDMAPLEFRDTLSFKPIYHLTGNVPAGMTINPYTGQVFWTPPLSTANKTFNIEVHVQNTEKRNRLLTQINQFQIHVNAMSLATAYVCNIYGALLNRRPTLEEMAQWTTNLQSGTTRQAFVTAISHTDERFMVLTKITYLNVLSRQPTNLEYQSALSMFRSGGNSDQLTKLLLVGLEFSKLHPSNADYVNAVNQILVFKLTSSRIVAWEQRWLAMGGSKASLVNWIFKSQSASIARTTQLSSWYFDSTNSRKISQWATALSKGRLNSDSIQTNMLSSSTYANSTSQNQVPNVQAPNHYSSSQYDRLNHLVYIMTGTNASRSQLDQLQSQIYHGQSWKNVANNVYISQSAATQRIQTQYQNLLNRLASSSEIATLMQTLPGDNQIQALRIQILGGSEYRARLNSSPDFVNSVFQTLTDKPATSTQINFWTQKLDSGFASLHFVKTVANSNTGKSGQIHEAYLDYLLRDPSTQELNKWLVLYKNSAPHDRAMALNLANTKEFRQIQLTAELLPSSN